MTRELHSNRPMRCLIVDDDLLIHALLGCSLETAGCEAECASSGEEGLRKALSCRPDIVFMDIEMPGLNGIETSGKMRAEPELSYRPVIIAFTSLDPAQTKPKCLAAGMDDFLGKPFSSESVTKMIERWGAARRTDQPDRACAGR